MSDIEEGGEEEGGSDGTDEESCSSVAVALRRNLGPAYDSLRCGECGGQRPYGIGRHVQVRPAGLSHYYDEYACEGCGGLIYEGSEACELEVTHEQLLGEIYEVDVCSPGDKLAVILDYASTGPPARLFLEACYAFGEGDVVRASYLKAIFFPNLFAWMPELNDAVAAGHVHVKVAYELSVRRLGLDAVNESMAAAEGVAWVTREPIHAFSEEARDALQTAIEAMLEARRVKESAAAEARLRKALEEQMERERRAAKKQADGKARKARQRARGRAPGPSGAGGSADGNDGAVVGEAGGGVDGDDGTVLDKIAGAVGVTPLVPQSDAVDGPIMGFSIMPKAVQGEASILATGSVDVGLRTGESLCRR